MYSVDWNEQWELFAPNFKDGKAHIELSIYKNEKEKKRLVLEPGGGFGDLSHPTTRLMLKRMAPLIQNCSVIDIGCGSGILSIAALLWKAKEVYGLDIDEAALKHSNHNLKINHLEKKASFRKALPKKFKAKGPLLVLMNMIPVEQVAAWKAQDMLHPLPKTILTSGILSAFAKEYLEWTSSLGWTCMESYEEDEWMAFLFKG